MDPDCAICASPAAEACDCEAKHLERSVKEAEAQVMRKIYNNIRTWVRSRAQDYILDYFQQLTSRRKARHAEHIDRLHTHAQYYYNAPPHPQSILDAEMELKHGIDEDWKHSVDRYPEVLEYFFSLVELTLPSNEDMAVRDPPLGGPNGHSKGYHGPPAIAASTYMPSRTPPPPDRHERRLPPQKRIRQSLPPQHAPYHPYPHAPQHAPYMQ